MAQNEAISRTRIIEWSRSRQLSRPWVIALGYLVALFIAEALTTLISPQAGMVLHGLILLALVVLAAMSYRRREYRFLVVLALAPLIRLLSLALPLANFPYMFWYAIVGIPLFIATAMGARVTGLKRNMIGLRFSWRTLPSQLLIGLSGLALGLIEYLILRPDPLVAEFRWELVLLPALILLIFTGFLEELIFRGLMQTSSLQELGRLGIVFVAVIFAVLHIGYRSIVDVIFVFAVAIIFGLLVQRYASLLGVSISHGLTNISLYLIFPFLLAAPLLPQTGAEDVPPIPPPATYAAPADIFSPKVITPFFSAVTTPTPYQSGDETPTATPPPTETATPTASPVPPTATPTPPPPLPPTQPPVIWPTLPPLPTATVIIPSASPTAEFPTSTPTLDLPSATPTFGLPPASATPSLPTTTPSLPTTTPSLSTATPTLADPTATSTEQPPMVTPTVFPTLTPTLIPIPSATSTPPPTLTPFPTIPTPTTAPTQEPPTPTGAQ